MEIHSNGLVAAVGQYGPFRDRPEQPPIPWVDWLDSAGGVYRALLPAGMAAPVALQQGRAVLDLEAKDRGGFQLRAKSFELAEGRKAA
jgi:hypothetical protein